MSRPKPPGSAMHTRGPSPTSAATRRARAATPTVAVLPPVGKMLDSLEAIIAAELVRMRAAQRDNPDKPLDARGLDALAGALGKVYRTQREVLEDAIRDMAGKSDEELAALAAGTDPEDGT